MNINDLQIVIIKNLKNYWSDPDIRTLFSNIVDIKLAAYGNVYGDNVISLDKADYFGTHLIVCKKGIRLKPLFSYKSVTLNECEKFLMEFPGISLLKSDGHEEALGFLIDILKSCKANNKNVSFDYSWAQDPSIKELRSIDTKVLFQDIAMLMAVNHMKDYGIDKMITCGVLKVKTDLFFKKLGLTPLSKFSQFNQTSINGDLVEMFHSEKFSSYALEASKKYQSLWENKIIIGDDDKDSFKLVA